jgi:hypothetical protein
MFNLLLNNSFVGSLLKFHNDLLRDSNSKKYSLSRAMAFILFGVVIFFHIKAIGIMIDKKEIDHSLLIEDFAFISAIIFHKNYINSKNIEGDSTVPPVEPPTDPSI